MNIGLFISRDNGVISKAIDVDALSKEYAYLPAVKVLDTVFSMEGQQAILQDIAEKKLDAVVIAGNSPLYFENTFSAGGLVKLFEVSGINPARIAFANIKEQVALPHWDKEEEARHKAKLIIDRSIARVNMCENIESISISPRRSVVIIGSGTGAIIGAFELLEKGYKVHIVEKSSKITGASDENVIPSLTAVQANKNGIFYFQSRIVDVSGWYGDYTIKIDTPDGFKTISVGGIIVTSVDDDELNKAIKPLLIFDIRDARNQQEKNISHIVGRTKDPGIWYSVALNGKHDFMTDLKNSSLVVLELTNALDKNEIKHKVLISEVDLNVCCGCGTCVKTCAFGASSLDMNKKISVIDPRRCKACGNCVVACPTGARDIITFPEHYVSKAIEILSQGIPTNKSPKILAFLCNGSGLKALDRAGKMTFDSSELAYSTNVMPLRIECAGNVDTQYILEAFNKGFDGVIMCVCKDGECHNLVGNTDMERRINLFRDVLRSRRIDSERMRIVKLAPNDAKFLCEELNDFSKELERINSNA